MYLSHIVYLMSYICLNLYLYTVDMYMFKYKYIYIYIYICIFMCVYTYIYICTEYLLLDAIICWFVCMFDAHGPTEEFVGQETTHKVTLYI